MRKRVHIVIRGAVQGVGFRPFVYRLANELRLHGWVINASDGVTIEAEGEPGERGGVPASPGARETPAGLPAELRVLLP